MTCEHATSRNIVGKKPKTFCARMNCWTNCEEFDECIADEIVKKPVQLSMFEVSA